MSKDPTIKQQVECGFRRAGEWLLGMAWLGLVYWGIGAASEPRANLSDAQQPSRVLGFVLLASAAVIFVIMANRWKRVFPGIMLAATFGTLLELEHGYAVNNSSVLIPRWIAFVQFVVIAGVAALSFTFKERPLNTLDRIALLAFAGSIYLGGEETIKQKVPLTLIVGGFCVLFVWAIDRLKRGGRLPASNYGGSDSSK